ARSDLGGSWAFEEMIVDRTGGAPAFNVARGTIGIQGNAVTTTGTLNGRTFTTHDTVESVSSDGTVQLRSGLVLHLSSDRSAILIADLNTSDGTSAAGAAVRLDSTPTPQDVKGKYRVAGA